nr:MYB transcription factor protein [Rosa persica]
MAGKHIPEDIIMDILSRLPVKSLIRFRCVSKCWRSIVSDPQLAKLQFQVTSEKKTQSQNRLLPKLTGPFEHRDRISHGEVRGSCNGLVCVATPRSVSPLYIWNPSTGFSLKLPGFSNNETNCSQISYCGFGYFPATDDYKVLVAAYSWDNEAKTLEVKIFSTRTGLWKMIELPSKSCPSYLTSAAFLGESLHWLGESDFWLGPVIFAFDLVKEECREMPTLDQNHNTIYFQHVDSCGGCLYGFSYGSYSAACDDSDELWVMREYGVSNSWTKLFNLEFSNQLESECPVFLFPFLATNTSTVVAKFACKDHKMEIVRIEHEDEPVVTDRLRRRYHMPGIIIYEESLLQIPDYHAVIQEYKVKRAENSRKLKSRGIIASYLALFNYFWDQKRLSVKIEKCKQTRVSQSSNFISMWVPPTSPPPSPSPTLIWFSKTESSLNPDSSPSLQSPNPTEED